MFQPVHGEHCERCLTPVQPTFHSNLCKRWHGVEHLCPACVTYIESLAGPRLIPYLKEYGGCLFEELEFGEEKHNYKMTR